MTFMKNPFFNSSVLLSFFSVICIHARAYKMVNGINVYRVELLSFYSPSNPNIFETNQVNSKIELLLGDATNGQEINRCDLTLNLRIPSGSDYPSSTLLTVEKWIVSIEGGEIPFSGSGNELSKQAIKAIKRADKGLKITISVIYNQSNSGVNRPTTSEFVS